MKSRTTGGQEDDKELLKACAPRMGVFQLVRVIHALVQAR